MWYIGRVQSNNKQVNWIKQYLINIVTAAVVKHVWKSQPFTDLSFHVTACICSKNIGVVFNELLILCVLKCFNIHSNDKM